MQIVSIGDNLHDISKPVFWEKKIRNIINVSSAKLAQRVVKVILVHSIYDNFVLWSFIIIEPLSGVLISQGSFFLESIYSW